MKKNNQQTFRWSFFLKLVKNVYPKWNLLFFGILLGSIGVFASLLIPLAANRLITNFKLGFKIDYIYILCFFFIISALLSSVANYILGVVGEELVSNLRKSIWKQVLHLKIQEFDLTKSGELSSRVINDSLIFRILVSSSFPSLVTGIIQIIGSLVLMVFVDWKLTLLVILLVPLTLLYMIVPMNLESKVSKEIQDTLASFSGYITDRISQIQLIKTSGFENEEYNTGKDRISRLYNLGKKEAKINAVTQPILNLMILGSFILIILTGVYQVAHEHTGIGKLIAFIMYLFQLLSPIKAVGSFGAMLAKTKGATLRMFEIFQARTEDEEQGKEYQASGHHIRFVNVSFTYPNGNRGLDDVSWEAHPNQQIAFVGPSGGGKSTIFKLLERFYDVGDGEILVNHTNVNEIGLRSWRETIGLVSQDSALISGTIAENLKYGIRHRVTESDLWFALEQASASEFVYSLEDGLNTEIGERGMRLSGGQRQRLTLARAFLRNPNILMLDEATSALDSESEKKIQESLGKLMSNRTTLIIAHRLSTVLSASKIYFVEDGKITGVGKHEELLAHHLKYREYVENQFLTMSDKIGTY